MISFGPVRPSARTQTGGTDSRALPSPAQRSALPGTNAALKGVTVGPTMKTLEISTTVNLRGGKQNKPGLTLGRSAGPLRTNEEGFVHLSKDPLWAAENGDFCLCLHPHEMLVASKSPLLCF